MIEVIAIGGAVVWVVLFLAYAWIQERAWRRENRSGTPIWWMRKY